MDATAIKAGSASRPGPLRSGAPAFGRGSASAVGQRWAALHDAAAVVARIGGVEPGPLSPHVRNFPAAICEAGPARRALAEQGIDDLFAMLEPGASALLGAMARGVDARSAACALWREFVAARDALLRLAPAAEPRRPA